MFARLILIVVSSDRWREHFQTLAILPQEKFIKMTNT